MIKQIFLIILAVLPIFFICYYAYQKDKHKEPKRLLILLLFLGIISCILSIVITKIVSLFFPFINKTIAEMNLVEIFSYSFFAVAFIEEFCKWILLYAIGYYSKEFDEVYDIVLYSIFVSLGFALLENIFYITFYRSIQIGIVRGLLSVPGHACNSIFMGYYLSRAKLSQIRHNKLKSCCFLSCSLFLPILLHGIYDFCVFSNYKISNIILCFFVIILYHIALKTLQESASSKEQIIKSPTVFPEE